MKRRCYCYWLLLLLSCSCRKALLRDTAATPVRVFEDAWQVLDRQYAMFTYKQVNWQHVYQTFRPQVWEGMKEEALFDVIAAMLDSLRDGHVNLISATRIAAYTGYYKPYAENFNYTVVTAKYLKGQQQTAGAITYGVLGDIGYMYVPTFHSSVTAADIRMVLTTLSAVRAWVIDVRNNTGGELELADELAGHFINSAQLVKYDVYKTGAAHDAFGAPEAKFLQPVLPYVNKPVVILTNRRCFSSCNDFVWYASLCSQITLVGDRTGGGGGTPFEYALSNGWLLRYSATISVAPDGVNMEGGKNPDIEASNGLEDDVAQRDVILEKGLQWLQ